MTIQGIGQSYFTYTSLYTSSSSSSGTSETEESSGFEIPAPPMDVTEILSQDDANSDGVLTLDETPLSEEMFSSADADGDGELTSEELEEMLAGTPPPPPPMGGIGETDDFQDAESIMEADDANGDGVLTFDETPLTEEMFASADADGDGELTSEELEDYVTTAPGSGAGLASEEEYEELTELSASATASMIMDAYETASFGSLFGQDSEDDSSYQSLLSGLMI